MSIIQLTALSRGFTARQGRQSAHIRAYLAPAPLPDGFSHIDHMRGKENPWINLLAKKLRNGAPGRIRTHDPLVRSQVLYPTELRAHVRKAESYPNLAAKSLTTGGDGGIRTLDTGFAGMLP